MDFCVLHLCFQSVETAPKLDSEKNGVCIGIFSVFKGCARRRGGDHIYVYIYTHVYTYMLNMCVYTFIYICIYICRHTYDSRLEMCFFGSVSVCASTYVSVYIYM